MVDGDVGKVSADGRVLVLQTATRFTAFYTTYPMHFVVKQVLVDEHTGWCGGQLSDLVVGHHIIFNADFVTRAGRLQTNVLRATAVSLATWRDELCHTWLREAG